VRIYSENTQRRAGEEAHAEFIYIPIRPMLFMLRSHHIYIEREERTTSPFIYFSWRRRRKGARRRNSGGVLDGWISYKANLLESLVKTCFMRRALLV